MWPVETEVAGDLELVGRAVQDYATSFVEPPPPPAAIAQTLRPSVVHVIDNYLRFVAESWRRLISGVVIAIAIAIVAPGTDPAAMLGLCAALLVGVAVRFAAALRGQRLQIGPEGVVSQRAWHRPQFAPASAIHAGRLVVAWPKRALPWSRGLPALRLLLVDADGHALLTAPVWGFDGHDVASALTAAAIPCRSQWDEVDGAALNVESVGALPRHFPLRQRIGHLALLLALIAAGRAGHL